MSKPNYEFFNKKRQWSVVKDELLQCYLVPYFQKVLYTKRPIAYIDCFAGAGKFNDGKDGSPLMALKNIQQCLVQTKIVNPSIKSYFIEANHADLLRTNLNGYKNFEVINGKYEENILQILKSCVGQNIFLYIDPYGVKELDFNFLASLSNDDDFYTVEMLLNLNSVGFLRMAFAALNIEFKNEADLLGLEEYDITPPKALTETAIKVAGGDYWKEIIGDYRKGILNFYEAEERFVETYCKKLREHYRYVLNMPIRVKAEHSPKYRMIHATNHIKGVLLMADNMLRREQTMREIQQGRQLRLFEDAPNVDLKEILSGYLSRFKGFEHLNHILADFFCTYGVADVIPVLKNFEKQGDLLVERNPAKTKTGRSSKFFVENDSQQTVRLKWTT